jgi:hypothetical protein
VLQPATRRIPSKATMAGTRCFPCIANTPKRPSGQAGPQQSNRYDHEG